MRVRCVVKFMVDIWYQNSLSLQLMGIFFYIFGFDRLNLKGIYAMPFNDFEIENKLFFLRFVIIWNIDCTPSPHTGHQKYVYFSFSSFFIHLLLHIFFLFYSCFQVKFFFLFVVVVILFQLQMNTRQNIWKQ